MSEENVVKKRRGRPSVRVKRSVQITFRITDPQFNKLKEIAEQNGVGPHDMARTFIISNVMGWGNKFTSNGYAQQEHTDNEVKESICRDKEQSRSIDHIIQSQSRMGHDY